MLSAIISVLYPVARVDLVAEGHVVDHSVLLLLGGLLGILAPMRRLCATAIKETRRQEYVTTMQ
jgi:hypothetical protein